MLSLFFLPTRPHLGPKGTIVHWATLSDLLFPMDAISGRLCIVMLCHTFATLS